MDICSFYQKKRPCVQNFASFAQKITFLVQYILGISVLNWFRIYIVRDSFSDVFELMFKNLDKFWDWQLWESQFQIRVFLFSFPKLFRDRFVHDGDNCPRSSIIGGWDDHSRSWTAVAVMDDLVDGMITWPGKSFENEKPTVIYRLKTSWLVSELFDFDSACVVFWRCQF